MQQVRYLKILFLSLAIVCFGLVGGRLLFLVLYPPSASDFVKLLSEPQFRNFTLYGVLGGAFLAMVLNKRVMAYSIRRLLDDSVMGLGISLIFGRMACVVTGCCFGKTTQAWIGIPMVKGSLAHLNYLKDHPLSFFGGLPHLHFTQGYEVFVILLALGVALWVKNYGSKKRLKPGVVFWYFALTLTIGRFGVFFFRDFPDSIGISNVIRGPIIYGLSLLLLWKAKSIIDRK
jgi:phosphatidylglycerol:prolipoprotein diacylglycerol transferase